jgi:hypothetical protein
MIVKTEIQHVLIKFLTTNAVNHANNFAINN